MKSEGLKSYWECQLLLCKASGLSRRGWSRKTGINYDQLNYWHRKKNKSKGSFNYPLVAVKIKEEAISLIPRVLASISLKGDIELKFHDKEVLFEIMGRLRKCG